MAPDSLRVLYYLEPWIELDFPLFRLGTVRNHLRHELTTLCDGGCQVRLVLGEAVADAARRERLLDARATVSTIAVESLRAVFPNYLTASSAIYGGSATEDQLGRMAAIVRRAVGDYNPDVVIAYEGASAFLRTAYPDALILHSTLGMFSREPYPETFALDPLGSFKDSWLARFGPQLDTAASSEQAAFMGRLREHYLDGILRAENPIRRRTIRKGFDRVLLLPLQVSRYFVFDDNTPQRFASQFDYLCWVLEQVSPDVGIFVTEHPFEPVVTDRNQKWLSERFGNFVFDAELRRHRWLSQFVLDHVDGVIAVSSSVGFQAAFAQKPLHVVGRSHLAPLSVGRDVAHFASELSSFDADRDALLYHLITRYFPLTTRHLYRPEWYVDFLRRSLEKHRAGQTGLDFFDPIESTDGLLTAYLEESRSEKMRRELKRASVQPARQSIRPKRRGNPPSEVSERAIRKQIRAAKVISFDVFDTLLCRTLYRPEDVWRIVALRAEPLLARAPVPVDDFVASRRKAAQRALGIAAERGEEDTTISEIYSEFRKLHELDRETAAALRKLELDTEFRCTRRRRGSRRLYDYALELGKPVYLTSDMYLERGFVDHLLASNKYDRHRELLISSERKKRKKSGTLFDELISLAGVPARDILHIGDNPQADGEAARSRGLKSVLIPKTTDDLESGDAHARVIERVGNTPLASFTLGASAAKLFGDPFAARPDGSLFRGSARLLGYCAGGPIALAFAGWIMQEAIADGVDTLCFLARDGQYIKRAYDLLARYNRDAPGSEYVFASRRACSTAALVTTDDVLASMTLAFSETTISDLLRHRFDLAPDDIPAEVLQAAGFEGLHARVTSKSEQDRVRVTALLERLAPAILERAAGERAAYLGYLRSLGMGDARKQIAVVDIGHNGTLQLALSRLLGRPIGGYYFATFRRAQQVLEAGLPVSSYLLHLVENRNSDHYYCRNIGMFEFLFLPPERSFKRFDPAVRPATVESAEFVTLPEQQRMKVSLEVSRGVNEFLADADKAFGDLLPSFDWDPEEAVGAYAEFVQEPHLRDTRIVAGVSFADAFGGNAERFLIAPSLYSSPVGDAGNLVRESWWRAGATVVHTRRKGREAVVTNGKAWGGSAWSSVLRKQAQSLAESGALQGDSMFARKTRKLLKNPRRFWTDSKVASRLRGRSS